MENRKQRYVYMQFAALPLDDSKIRVGDLLWRRWVTPQCFWLIVVADAVRFSAASGRFRLPLFAMCGEQFSVSLCTACKCEKEKNNFFLHSFETKYYILLCTKTITSANKTHITYWHIEVLIYKITNNQLVKRRNK